MYPIPPKSNLNSVKLNLNSSISSGFSGHASPFGNCIKSVGFEECNHVKLPSRKLSLFPYVNYGMGEAARLCVPDTSDRGRINPAVCYRFI